MQTAYQISSETCFFYQSVGSAAEVKALQEQNAEMEKKMSELKIQIQVTVLLDG